MRGGSERSAGGVLVVPIGGALHVAAILALAGNGALGLPKGHIEPGEDPLTAALREVREETGMRGEPLAELGEISYDYWAPKRRRRVHKRVLFYLLAYRAGSPAHHDHEVAGVRLLPADEAPQALTYPSERAVVEEALLRLDAAGYRR